jgi:hypothetical protein
MRWLVGSEVRDHVTRRSNDHEANMVMATRRAAVVCVGRELGLLLPLTDHTTRPQASPAGLCGGLPAHILSPDNRDRMVQE